MALLFDNITFDTFFDDLGDPPEAWVLYTTSDASVSSPTWVDASAKLRGQVSSAGFSSSRGRETELAQVDTGTCTIELDNRARDFDPVANPAIRPLNRWWVRVQFAGQTQDVFKGWAERYDQTVADDLFNAVAVVSCADEFKLLGLDALPVTSPPRATYSDVVQSDLPSGYWPLTDPPEFRTQSAEVPGDPAPTPVTPGPPVWGGEWGDDWGWGMNTF